MKRRPFLFTLSFCLPVFFALAAGAGRPVVHVAPAIAAAAPGAPARGVRVAGLVRDHLGRSETFRYQLAPRFADHQGFPVRIRCLEITVFDHPNAGNPPQVTLVPYVNDPIWTVPFSIRMGGKATLRAIAEDGSGSALRTFSWHAGIRGCLVDTRKVTDLQHTFIFTPE